MGNVVGKAGKARSNGKADEGSFGPALMGVDCLNPARGDGPNAVRGNGPDRGGGLDRKERSAGRSVLVRLAAVLFAVLVVTAGPKAGTILGPWSWVHAAGVESHSGTGAGVLPNNGTNDANDANGDSVSDETVVTGRAGDVLWDAQFDGLTQPVKIEVELPQVDIVRIWHDETWDLTTVGAVNEAIRDKALAMILALAPLGNVDGGFETHVDRPDLLSVTMHYAGFLPPMAHPVHLRASVTANPKTGRVYSLSDLFVDESYVDVLSEVVALEIEAQELPLLVTFEKIAPDQDFYLTESHLVLYFQHYELVPYAWGFPEFRVPLASLKSIAKEDGPIAALLGAK